MGLTVFTVRSPPLPPRRLVRLFWQAPVKLDKGKQEKPRKKSKKKKGKKKGKKKKRKEKNHGENTRKSHQTRLSSVEQQTSAHHPTGTTGIPFVRRFGPISTSKYLAVRTLELFICRSLACNLVEEMMQDDRLGLAKRARGRKEIASMGVPVLQARLCQTRLGQEHSRTQPPSRRGCGKLTETRRS